MGLGISKRYSSYSFHPISAKLYEDIGHHRGVQTVTFLANQPSFTNCVALELLTCESHWENLKMCNIFKMADRRMEWMKFWTLLYT